LDNSQRVLFDANSQRWPSPLRLCCHFDDSEIQVGDLLPIGGSVLGPFAERSVALDAEENWIKQCWLPNGDDQGERVSQHNPTATPQPRGG